MRKIKKLIFLSALAVPSIASAADWSEKGTVSNLRVKNGTEISGNFAGANLQCGSRRFVFDIEIPKQAHLFSLLLTEKVEGATVKLWQIGCEEGGSGTVINGAQIS